MRVRAGDGDSPPPPGGEWGRPPAAVESGLGRLVPREERVFVMGKFCVGSRKVLASLLVVLLSLSLCGAALAAEKELKIGVLGVMSGPAASWGLVNRYCAEASAKMINDKGGFQIGDDTYKIKIVAIDDRNDPKVSVSGAERLIYEEGIRYIIGPNIDPTSMAINTARAAVGQHRTFGRAFNY